jgi:hypothetical protein
LAVGERRRTVQDGADGAVEHGERFEAIKARALIQLALVCPRAYHVGVHARLQLSRLPGVADAKDDLEQHERRQADHASQRGREDEVDHVELLDRVWRIRLKQHQRNE